MSEGASLFLRELRPDQRRSNLLDFLSVDLRILVRPDNTNVGLVLGFLDLLHEVGEQVLLLHLLPSRFVGSLKQLNRRASFHAHLRRFSRLLLSRP